jgi:hypothetical protein
MERALIVDALWEKAEPLLYISKDEFSALLEGWTIEGVEHEGELAFAFLSKGPQFHFQSFSAKQPITLKMIKTYLQPLIDRYGYVTTKTPKDDTRQHRFNRRFGFAAVGDDNFDIHYRLERIRPCP